MPTRSDLEWALFALAGAVAAHFVAVGSTPIDRDLPFVIVLLAASGWIAGARLVQISVPLLLVAAMVLPDDRTRLFAYGLIAAAAYAWAVFQSSKIWIVIPGVMLLRWIPLSGVVVWRELIVMLGALCIPLIRPSGTFSPQAGRRSSNALAPRERGEGGRRPGEGRIVIALAIALITPIYPARMMLFPFLIAILLVIPLPRIVWAIPFAIAAYFARYSIATLCVVAALAFLVESIRFVRVPAYVCAVAFFSLWPWSGIVARAMPRFLAAEEASKNERPVWVALEAGRSVSIDAPPHAHYVVITASGANAASLPAGRPVGWVEVVGRGGDVMRRDLRIGDLADFGFTRPEHFFASSNTIPHQPLDDIKGYGISAWLHTAGRISRVSPDDIARVRATACADLPAGTKLQIEAVEFE